MDDIEYHTRIPGKQSLRYETFTSLGEISQLKLRPLSRAPSNRIKAAACSSSGALVK